MSLFAIGLILIGLWVFVMVGALLMIVLMVDEILMIDEIQHENERDNHFGDEP